MGRPHRFSFYDGLGNRCYFVTVSTFRRRKWFRQRSVVAMTLNQILRAAWDRSFAITAYCFMPDHMHALVSGDSPDADFNGFVRVAKQLSGYKFSRMTGRRLWKDSYWDRTLRGDAVPVIRYIVMNPVKAGLVSNPLDYPYWGSEIYTRRELLGLVATDDAG